jgi:hypothetical protein
MKVTRLNPPIFRENLQPPLTDKKEFEKNQPLPLINQTVGLQLYVYRVRRFSDVQFFGRNDCYINVVIGIYSIDQRSSLNTIKIII